MLSRNYIELSQTLGKCHSLWRWLIADQYRYVVARYSLYVEVKRERETLAKLTDSELRDIGIHRADADAESQRSFSDVPADRLGLYVGLNKGESRKRM